MSSIHTVMGFDFGMRHIGVAIGQVLTETAQACTTLPAWEGQPDWIQLSNLLKKWQPDALIVGVPVDLAGHEHAMTLAARYFLSALSQRFAPLPVFSAEERLTSVEARARLFEQGGYKSLRKSSIDSLAAQLIVESWVLQYNRSLL